MQLTALDHIDLSACDLAHSEPFYDRVLALPMTPTGCVWNWSQGLGGARPRRHHRRPGPSPAVAFPQTLPPAASQPREPLPHRRAKTLTPRSSFQLLAKAHCLLVLRESQRERRAARRPGRLAGRPTGGTP